MVWDPGPTTRLRNGPGHSGPQQENSTATSSWRRNSWQENSVQYAQTLVKQTIDGGIHWYYFPTNHRWQCLHRENRGILSINCTHLACFLQIRRHAHKISVLMVVLVILKVQNKLHAGSDSKLARHCFVSTNGNWHGIEQAVAIPCDITRFPWRRTTTPFNHQLGVSVNFAGC
jgi:hypothetical protein